jgi:hypothetical protein
LKKNRDRRSEMRTSPPITLPMIAFVVVPWLVLVVGEEIAELPDGTLVEVTAVGVLLEDVEDATGSGAFCWTK